MTEKRKIEDFSAGCRSWTSAAVGDAMRAYRGRPALWRGVVAAFLVSALWASAVPAQDTNPVYTLQADGLACPFCAYGVEKQLSRIEGVVAIETEIKTGTVTVTMRDGAVLDEATAKKAVEAAGFTLRGFERGRAAE